VTHARKRVRRRPAAQQWVGRDVARATRRAGRRRRLSAALLLGALAAALSLAALRVDILRLRYALADALAQEKALLETRRVATAQIERLRDPARLAKLASARGLARSSHVVELSPLPATTQARR
jgi:hypothetical protein